MAQFLQGNFTWNQRKCRIMILALIWCTGLFCGVYSLEYTGNTFPYLIQTMLRYPASLRNLVTVSLLPLLLSAFAVYIHSAQLFILICFLKAWLFGLIGASLLLAFGSAGWLIGSMFLLPDILGQVMLWWFWISHVGGGFAVGRIHAGICIAVTVLAAGLDYCYISPFMVSLIEF